MFLGFGVNRRLILHPSAPHCTFGAQKVFPPYWTRSLYCPEGSSPKSYIPSLFLLRCQTIFPSARSSSSIPGSVAPAGSSKTPASICGRLSWKPLEMEQSLCPSRNRHEHQYHRKSDSSSQRGNLRSPHDSCSPTHHFRVRRFYRLVRNCCKTAIWPAIRTGCNRPAITPATAGGAIIRCGDEFYS